MPKRFPTWPNQLPYKPERGNYVEPFKPVTERTEFEAGNTRQRLKRSVPVQIRPYRLAFKVQEREEFHEFWFDSLNQGTGRFWMPALNIRFFWELHEVQIIGGDVDYEEYGWIGGVPAFLAIFNLRIFHEITREQEQDD